MKTTVKTSAFCANYLNQALLVDKDHLIEETIL